MLEEAPAFDFDEIPGLTPLGHDVNDMFLTHSVHSNVANTEAALTPNQVAFLHKSIDASFSASMSSSSDALPVASLQVFVGLGQYWGVPKATISTLYVTTMWWSGKDLEVSDLLSNIPASTFDAALMVENGVR
jgi:hypothetical protein